MTDELPSVIRLSTAIIDRYARLIIEKDEHTPGRINVDNGVNKYHYTGEDAKLLWDFYHPETQDGWR